MNWDSDKLRAERGESSGFSTGPQSFMSPTTDEMPPGAMIGGVYRVESLLGSGGMSHVYRCQDLSLNRYVAIKVLRSEIGANPANVMRFQREGQAVALLEHPNIVKVHAMQFTESQQPFMVMEIVSGTTLANMLATNGALPLFRASKFVNQICDALQHAHDLGIVHRDLKPGNIMIINSGRSDEHIKLLDFGIAKVLSETAVRATQTGEIFGSPTYMSPEQSLGKVVDARSDQYSLGCVIFEVLTGHPPFDSESPLQVMMAHVQQVPPTLKKSGHKDFPAHVERSIARMLAKEPELRFDTVREARDAFFGEKPAGAGAKGGGGKASGDGPWKKPLLIAAAVLLLIVLALVLFMLFGPAQERPMIKPLETVPTKNSALSSSSMLPTVASPADKLVARAVHGRLTGNTFDIEELAEAIGNLTDLTEVSDDGLAVLLDHPQYVSVNLKGCSKITAKSIRILANLPNLQDLELTDTEIGDDAIASIIKMPKLTRLKLARTRLTDKGLIELVNSKVGKQLKKLDVSETGVTDIGVKEIPKMPSLITFDVHRTVFLSDACLISLSKCPLLEDLNIHYNTQLTGSTLPALGKVKTLTRINLGTTSVHQNLRNILKTNVQRLDVSNDSVSDDDIDILLALKKLKSLELNNNEIFTDDGLMKLVVLPNLRKINCADTQVTPDGRSEFLQKYKELYNREPEVKIGKRDKPEHRKRGLMPVTDFLDRGDEIPLSKKQ